MNRIPAARADQFRLLQWILSHDGPRFGPSMETRAFFIAAAESMAEWDTVSVAADALEQRWCERLVQSGALSSKNQTVAVFGLPYYSAGAATFQVRRTVDHRVLCLYVPSTRLPATPNARYEMIQRRLAIRVVGQLVRVRRSAAEQNKCHKDDVLDVHMRLASAETAADRSGFLLNDTITTPAIAIIESAHGVLQDPLPSGNDASGVLYALFNYLCDLRTRTREQLASPAPRENLDRTLVYGEIAHYIVVEGRMRTCLFMHDDIRIDSTAVVQRMTEPVCTDLVLCPLNGNDHWTLLYRYPGENTVPCLVDSLCPKTIGQSYHGALARKYGGARVTLVDIPIDQKQRGATCGLYVIAAACFLVYKAPPIPVHDLNGLVEHVYQTISTVWSHRDTSQFDTTILNMLTLAAKQLLPPDDPAPTRA